MTLGARIMRARLLRGAWSDPPRDLRQRGVAKALGVSQGLVALWESGKRSPGRENARDLARYLGVSLDWLLDGIGPMFKELHTDANIDLRELSPESRYMTDEEFEAEMRAKEAEEAKDEPEAGGDATAA